MGQALCTEDYIYIVGGAKNNGLSSIAEAYDIEANRWVRGPPLPRPQEAYPVLLGGGTFILVAGGEGPNEAAL